MRVKGKKRRQRTSRKGFSQNQLSSKRKGIKDKTPGEGGKKKNKRGWVYQRQQEKMRGEKKPVFGGKILLSV